MAKTSFERVDGINRKHVQSALSAVHDTKLSYELADGSETGLSLRVRSRSAAWWLRGRLGPKQTYWRIADLRPDDDPREMRRRAAEAKLMLARGVDPKGWLAEQETGGPVERHFDDRDGWTWKTGVTEFLDYIKKERSEGTYLDYRPILTGKWCKGWNDRLLKSISATDVKTLQDDIYSAGHPTQAKHTLRVVKSFLKWASGRGRSGIETSVARDVDPIKSAQTARPGRVPTAEEIGRLAWQLDAARILPAARLAALLVIFTAQRRETVMSATVDEFIDDPDHGLIWISGHTKRKRRPGDIGHAIPLAPGAAAIARAALTMAGATGWLFPQSRLRKATDKGGGHMAPKTPEKAMGKAGSAVNPHDIRRAFAVTVEEELGFSRLETKLILDHSEGKSGDVTAQHYALHHQLRLKKPVIDAWDEWVLKQINAHRPDVTVALPAALAGVVRRE